MAHISKRNGKWQATYRGPDGKERTATRDRRIDAQRWLDTNQADIARGTWVDPRAGRVTLGEYAEAWGAGQVWRPSTARAFRIRLETHIAPALGDVPIAALRPSLLQAWVKDR